MSHPINTTVTLVAAVANGIAQSQSLAAAGPLVFNGPLVNGAGVAVFDAPRRIAIFSNGNDSGITWTITGMPGPWNPNPTNSETITGGNGVAVTSNKDYSGLISIVSSGPTASTVYAGTSSIGSGPPLVWSTFFSNQQVSAYGVVLSGAPTWTIEYTHDDPYGLWSTPPLLWFPYGPLQNLTGTADGVLPAAIRASRLTITGPGSVRAVQEQQGF
jgi:hypothetical protein